MSKIAKEAVKQIAGMSSVTCPGVQRAVRRACRRTKAAVVAAWRVDAAAKDELICQLRQDAIDLLPPRKPVTDRD